MVGDHQLPYEPTEQGKGTHNSENELNMFQFKGKSSNVFNISINYPPNEDEKEDIKRMNTEDIFPENIAAPNIDTNNKNNKCWFYLGLKSGSALLSAWSLCQWL